MQPSRLPARFKKNKTPRVRKRWNPIYISLQYNAFLMNCIRKIPTGNNFKIKSINCKFSHNQENKKAAHLFAVTNAAALQSGYMLFQYVDF